MVNESDTPINSYKVKAHIGVIGIEFTDAIAKHAALHNYGHDEAFPPPSPDGNPFAHMYWLAEENNETSHTTTEISLAPLQNIKDKLKAHMSKHHRLGDANTNSGYYNYWKRLLTFVNLTTSNSFWSNTRINLSQKRNVLKSRTGTLYTQKMAHLYGRATNSSCLLCHQPDSQIHMLSGCQNASIQNMVTERHNIVSRLIIKTLNKGDLEETSCLQILEVKHGWLNKVWSYQHMQPTELYPNCFYQIFQQTNFDPAQDQMLFASCQLERRMAIKETYRLYTLRAGMYTSLK